MAKNKVFVSYCGKNPKVTEWIEENLVKRLNKDGVEVVWAGGKDGLDLGVGIHSFIEKMYDADIGRILVVCDREYQQKANKQKNGVGKEIVIISNFIYAEKVKERRKVIPIIFERDEEGNPFLPNTLKADGRFFADFSEPSKFEEQYDGLINNIYQEIKPINEKDRFTLFDQYPDHLDLNKEIMAHLLVEATGLTADVSESHFADISGKDWFFKYAEILWSNGLIRPDITRGGADFNPKNPVLRGHGILLIVEAFGLPEFIPKLPTFMDVPKESWLFPWAETAYHWNVLEEAKDGLLSPNENIKIGEFKQLLNRVIFDIKERGQKGG